MSYFYVWNNRRPLTLFYSIASILDEVHIETEIGDEAKQVLRNVRKIETFIVEQLMALVDNLLIFPSYYSIPLESDDVSSSDYEDENSNSQYSDAVSID